jgi:bzd-type benzoyl-CoA reductase N subunit
MSTIESASGGLAMADKLYQNRGGRARELKAQGKKVIGYFCNYPPVEFLTALDLVPFRIMGRPPKATSHADTCLETIICPYLRSCFDMALDGSYDFLDGLVVPHSCDVVQRIYDIWKYYCKPAYSHFLNVPHMTQPSSFEFFKKELALYQRSLENFTGKQISPDGLRNAIKLHNENRALLRELYEFRKLVPPLVSGTEATKILVAGLTIPAAEFNELLRSVVEEVKKRPHGSKTKRPRILLYGCEMDDITFVQLVESIGADVVIDDLCIGSRSFWLDVPKTSDPLDGLAEHYLEGIRCPRTYKPSISGHQSDLDNRFGYLLKYVKDFHVDGAILSIMMYCDTHELDVPDVKEILQKSGVKVLHLDNDYSMSNIGQLRVRIEAFLELIA